MRIGVDIDNVISTFNEQLLEEFLKHNKELGYSDKINKDADYKQKVCLIGQKVRSKLITRIILKG